MKVLMVSTDFLPNIGGIAAHVDGLCQGLQHNQAEVQLVVPGFAASWCRSAHAMDPAFPYPVWRLALPRFLRLSRLYPCWAVAWLRHQGLFGADLLHWHTFDQRTVRWLRSLPRVFTNHTSHFLQFEADPARRHLARRILAPADTVICPSDELAESTIRCGFPAGRTQVVYNGVDARRFTPQNDGAEARRRYGIGEHDMVFLCPRRLEKKNGVVYWVEAIPEIVRQTPHTCRFLFVGDYVDDDRYSARAEVLAAIRALNMGDRIIFAGAVAPADMPAVVAASDVVVLPSLQEATSIAGLEAMASGKPLVGTNVGGIPTILADGETGFLVPPRDPAALAAAALRLLADASLRNRLGANARTRAVAEFSWDRVAERTLVVYRQVLEQACAN